jgi:hypothetical protein
LAEKSVTISVGPDEGPQLYPKLEYGSTLNLIPLESVLNSDDWRIVLSNAYPVEFTTATPGKPAGRDGVGALELAWVVGTGTATANPTTRMSATKTQEPSPRLSNPRIWLKAFWKKIDDDKNVLQEMGALSS